MPTHSAANIQNDPVELHRSMELKIRVTADEQNQLTRVATLPAVPFTCAGKISDMIIHGIAPTPKENAAI